MTVTVERKVEWGGFLFTSKTTFGEAAAKRRAVLFALVVASFVTVFAGAGNIADASACEIMAISEDLLQKDFSAIQTVAERIGCSKSADGT